MDQGSRFVYAERHIQPDGMFYRYLGLRGAYPRIQAEERNHPYPPQYARPICPQSHVSVQSLPPFEIIVRNLYTEMPPQNPNPP